MGDLVDEINKLKDMVEDCLKNDSNTRNSDILLTIRVWQKFYGVEDTIRLSKLYDLPTMDSITRVRRKFQGTDGLYLPTVKEIAIQRGINEIEWQKALGYNVQGELF